MLEVEPTQSQKDIFPLPVEEPRVNQSETVKFSARCFKEMCELMLLDINAVKGNRPEMSNFA